LFATSTDEHVPEWMHTREDAQLLSPERWGLLGAYVGAILSLRAGDPESFLRRRAWTRTAALEGSVTSENDPVLHHVPRPR
jgi:hypothetical protein